MKKTIAIIAVIMLLSALALTFTACSPAGTYYFESMKYTSGGVSIEYKAGEQNAMGITIEATAATLVLNKDGTYVFESSIPGATFSEKGTWVKDGDKITFDDEFTATLSGKTLTADMGGATLVMKK